MRRETKVSDVVDMGVNIVQRGNTNRKTGELFTHYGSKYYQRGNKTDIVQEEIQADRLVNFSRIMGVNMVQRGNKTDILVNFHALPI